jgi:hypothetical protein
VTYLERYTLLAITGLAAKDQDDDGEAGGAGAMMSADEKQQLADTLRETGADLRRFLAYFKIASLDKLPLARFGEAMMLLEQKRKTAQKDPKADPGAPEGKPTIGAPGTPQAHGPAFVAMKPPSKEASDKAWRAFGAQLVAQHRAIAGPQREAWQVVQSPAFNAIRARSAQLHSWVMDQIQPLGTGDAA